MECRNRVLHKRTQCLLEGITRLANNALTKGLGLVHVGWMEKPFQTFGQLAVKKGSTPLGRKLANDVAGKNILAMGAFGEGYKKLRKSDERILGHKKYPED